MQPDCISHVENSLGEKSTCFFWHIRKICRTIQVTLHPALQFVSSILYRISFFGTMASKVCLPSCEYFRGGSCILLKTGMVTNQLYFEQ